MKNPEEMKRKIMMIVKIGMILWIIGFLMILTAIYKEFLGSYVSIVDSTASRTLMTLKLGGIGFTLSGIFLSLIAIVKVLSMMPDRLSMLIKKK
ncbi:hypothetical protein HYX16_00615 [Candidatus Woesearchaeota archaeon]|nr:hypothetical protein [Candidatus Woesearchaeota archaeon]